MGLTTMPEPLRLGLIFGGRSIEHEVSVVSAQDVIAAADPDRLEIVPIGVTKTGVWLSPKETGRQLDRADPQFQKTLQNPAQEEGPDADRPLTGVAEALSQIDVVFPLIHGSQGEDGTIQGLLELAGLAYVGCGVAASAVGMDKGLMKALFRAAGFDLTQHMVVYPSGRETEALTQAREIETEIGLPVFVKPANGGSSVGIHKASGREQLATALLAAREIDRKLIVEREVIGREIECGVLGNQEAQASAVGEVRYEREFYDYEAKYIDPRSQVLVPADLPPKTAARVQELALGAFYAIGGAGMSRVDFFLRPDGSLVLSEINTIPGFTPASMFPRLWQALGVSYTELITRLVELALARNQERLIV